MQDNELILPQYGRRETLALRLLQAGCLGVIVAASTYKSFELDRYFVPKELVLHLTAFAALLLAARAFRKSFFTRVDTLLLGYLAISAASALFATNHWLAIRALSISASGVAVFWAARALRDVGLARPVIGALGLAVVLGALSALLQTYGLRLDIFSINRAPGGTLGNRNFVAHLAAFGLPLLLLVALRARSTLIYVMGSVGAATVVGTLVLTRSRAAWLAFAAAILMFMFGLVASRALRRDGRTWLRFLCMFLFAGGAVFAVVYTPNSLRWRSENPYLQSIKGVANYQEGSGRGRLIQYKRSLRMTVHNPVLGVGPGNWAVRYPEFAARRDPSLNNSQPGTTANPWPSSDWVGFMAERGFIGVLLLLGAFAAMSLQAIRRLIAADDATDAFTAAAVLATIAAVMVAGAFDAVLLLGLPSLIIWATLGVLWLPAANRETDTRPQIRKLAVMVLLLVVGVGVLRSGAQLFGMNVYENSDSRSALATASLIDPGNYRLQMKLARMGKKS
ncbi:MAG TPA: O-antigen ligase family protein, partial [Longimicrobiales bacterium]|nr:O-antigen ligase family protein [Longimicrobiales bacterium]